MAFIEDIAPLIGEVLFRFRIEESLVESETRFRSLFERHAAPAPRAGGPDRLRFLPRRRKKIIDCQRQL